MWHLGRIEQKWQAGLASVDPQREAELERTLDLTLSYESEVADFRQTAIAHLRMAAPFAVAQFSAFCEAVIEQFKR